MEIITAVREYEADERGSRVKVFFLHEIPIPGCIPRV
jgi:hypothetical protein